MARYKVYMLLLTIDRHVQNIVTSYLHQVSYITVRMEGGGLLWVFSYRETGLSHNDCF